MTIGGRLPVTVRSFALTGTMNASNTDQIHVLYNWDREANTFITEPILRKISLM